MKKVYLVLFLAIITGSFTDMYASAKDHASQIRLYKSLSITAKMWEPESPVSLYADTIVTLLTNYNDEKESYKRAVEENDLVEMDISKAKLLIYVTEIDKNEKLIEDALNK